MSLGNHRYSSVNLHCKLILFQLVYLAFKFDASTTVEMGSIICFYSFQSRSFCEHYPGEVTLGRLLLVCFVVGKTAAIFILDEPITHRMHI